MSLPISKFQTSPAVDEKSQPATIRSRPQIMLTTRSALYSPFLKLPLPDGRIIYVDPKKDHYVRGINYGNWLIREAGSKDPRKMTLRERRELRRDLKKQYGSSLFGKAWKDIAKPIVVGHKTSVILQVSEDKPSSPQPTEKGR